MSANIIVRDVLVERLSPGIRPEWRVVKTQRTTDRIPKTTIVFRQKRITKEPAAPGASRRAYFEVVIASPLDDTGAAEERLDDEIIDFLNACDAADNVVWEEAEKGIWSDQNPAPCYLVTLYITYNKEGNNHG